MSLEDREKRRKALLGRPRPDAVKAKISQSHIGKKHSDETKQKISAIQKGRPPAPGTVANLRRMAQARIGVKRPERNPEWITKLAAANRGRILSEERRTAISKSLLGNTRGIGRIPWNKGKTGLGGYTWKKGAKTPKDKRFRLTIAYKNWRTAIFERDDFTCQICRKRGGKLNADHIKTFAHHPDLRLELSNGRTLCEPCHRKTDTYGLKAARPAAKK